MAGFDSDGAGDSFAGAGADAAPPLAPENAVGNAAGFTASNSVVQGGGCKAPMDFTQLARPAIVKAGCDSKCHGGTDPEGFAAAVDVGYDMVRYELLNKIKDTLLRHAREEAEASKVGGAAS